MLNFAARHGRWALILGLAVGLFAPGLAAFLFPWIGEIVAVLLFLNAFRVGHRVIFAGLAEVGRSLAIIVALQLIAPLIALALFAQFGWIASPFALAVILMLSAPSLTGTPNFMTMIGRDPADAMRLLVWGTAAFPFSAFVILWALPGVSGAQAFGATLWLAIVILVAVGAGFIARAIMAERFTVHTKHNTEGASAIVLAIVVIGLMAEVGPLLRSDPSALALWLGAVIALNFGIHILTSGALKAARLPQAISISAISSNRNIGLFLVALPEEFMRPLIVFIGCYQVPMYLTPFLMRWLHRK